MEKWEAGIHVLIGKDKDIKSRPERSGEPKENKESPKVRYYRTREDDLLDLELGAVHKIKVRDKETSKRETGKIRSLCNKIEEDVNREFEVTGKEKEIVIKRIK